MKKCHTRCFQEKVSGNNSNERSWAVTTSFVSSDTAAKFRLGKKNISVPPTSRSNFGKRRYQSERLKSLFGKRNAFSVTCGYLATHSTIKSGTACFHALKKSTYVFSWSSSKRPTSSANVYSSTPVRFPSARHRISIPIRIHQSTTNN